MVLTSTSATALLVTSTFCGESHHVRAIRCRDGAEHGLFCPPAGVGPTSHAQSSVESYLFHLFKVIIQFGPFGSTNLLTDQLLGTRRRKACKGTGDTPAGLWGTTAVPVWERQADGVSGGELEKPTVLGCGVSTASEGPGSSPCGHCST